MSTVDRFLEDAIAHYGVKGMKWGVRKKRGSVDVETISTPGKRVKAKGGQGQSASNDAVRAAALRQKAKASTVDSLSNKELQDLVQRMNLERQLNQLKRDNAPFVQKAVNRILERKGNLELDSLAADMFRDDRLRK